MYLPWLVQLCPSRSSLHCCRGRAGAPVFQNLIFYYYYYFYFYFNWEDKMFVDIHTDTPNLHFSSHESLLTLSSNCESSLLLFPSLLVHIQMFDFQVPFLSLLVAIQAYFWNCYLPKINMKVFLSMAQALLPSTLKIMLLFEELHKDPREKLRTAYRCTFQNSMKWGIKISPNTLSFKKLFPTELIGNLQRITLLLCPSQICRQTKEESFEQCAALLGEFSRVVGRPWRHRHRRILRAIHAQVFAEWGSAQ